MDKWQYYRVKPSRRHEVSYSYARTRRVKGCDWDEFFVNNKWTRCGEHVFVGQILNLEPIEENQIVVEVLDEGS